MRPYYAQDTSICYPWQFAPWNPLSLDPPSWVKRGMWYGGQSGEWVVVKFTFCDDELGYQGHIDRYEILADAESEFARVENIEAGDWGHYAGVYLFWRHELRKWAGSRFDEYTGERELPDGRW